MAIAGDGGGNCARLNGTTGALQQVLILHTVSIVNSVIFSNTAKVTLSTLFTRIEQSWRLYSSVKFVGLCIARSSSVPETCNHSQGEFSAIAIRQMERYVEQPTPQTTNPL